MRTSREPCRMSSTVTNIHKSGCDASVPNAQQRDKLGSGRDHKNAPQWRSERRRSAPHGRLSRQAGPKRASQPWPVPSRCTSARARRSCTRRARPSRQSAVPVSGARALSVFAAAQLAKKRLLEAVRRASLACRHLRRRRQRASRASVQTCRLAALLLLLLQRRRRLARPFCS